MAVDRSGHAVRVGVVVFCTALAACGGGGGGSAVPEGGNPAPDATGFVPAAPALGSTLYADASVLWPLRDRSQWVYRGVRVSSSPALNYSSYRTLVASAGGFIESTRNDFEGELSERAVSVASGVISVRESLVGTASISYVSLRSPIRINDQATLIDQKGVSLGEDLDGDSRNDVIDIGAYSRVIGNEQVSLPELGRTLSALRVDTNATARVTLSSMASPEPALTIVVSTWYAQGIGVVRETATVPVTSGIGAVDTDERLQYWDGVDSGVGMWPSVRVAKPGGSSTLGPFLAFPYSAIAVGNQAFVLSSIGGDVRPDVGVAVSVLDSRGNALATAEHRNLGLDVNARPQLMPLGARAAFALTEPGEASDPTILENLRLVAFDVAGQRTTTSLLVQGALPRTLKAASDGQTVWVTWVERTPPFGPSRVMTQRFDANAVPLAIPQVLDSRADSTPDSTEIAAASGRAMISWRVPYFLGDEYRHAIVDTAGTVTAGTLALGANTVGEPARPVPWVSSSLAAITWYRPLNQTVTPLPQPPLHGVTLDASAAPRRSTAAAIDSEVLPLPAHDALSVALAIDGDSFLWSAAGADVLTASELVPDRFVELRSLSPNNGALAATSPIVRRMRDSSPTVPQGMPPIQIQRIVPMPDRWLILGHNGTHLTTAVVHRD